MTQEHSDHLEAQDSRALLTYRLHDLDARVFKIETKLDQNTVATIATLITILTTLGIALALGKIGVH